MSRGREAWVWVQPYPELGGYHGGLRELEAGECLKQLLFRGTGEEHRRMEVYLSPQTLPCILERIAARPQFRTNRAQREEKGCLEQASVCLQMELMWRLEDHIFLKKKKQNI